MEFSIFKLLFPLAWFLSGIFLLDRVNASPVKWQKFAGTDEKNHKLEWIVLFAAPLYYLWCFARKLWQGHLGDLYHLAKRRVKYSNISISDSQGNPLYGIECDNPAIDELKNILNDAIIQRASDIFLDPTGENQYSLRFRVDGQLIVVKKMDSAFGENVVNAIKVAASMDITEKRRPQDGSFAATHPAGSVALRVATVGAFGGEKIALRLLGSQSGPKSLEEIGFDAQQLALLKNAVSLSSGMVLMCGATGSGKTTTLYALIDTIDYTLKNVISIEDPIERIIPNVSQMEVNTKADITFAKILRNALRQNPDVICLGEIRDEETAEIAVHAAQTGHLIISTVHSNDSVDTLDRLSSLGVPLASLAATIKVIVNQRLARRLCEKCKQPMTQMPKRWYDFFMQRGLDPSGLYVPVGCPDCNNTGYRGRVACFDILVIDQQLREELEKDHASLAQIKKMAAERTGNNTLAAHGAKLAAEGITTLEEIDRIALAVDGGLQ